MATCSLQLRVSRAIDLAHAARAKGGDHLVRAEACAGYEGHRPTPILRVVPGPAKEKRYSVQLAIQSFRTDSQQISAHPEREECLLWLASCCSGDASVECCGWRRRFHLCARLLRCGALKSDHRPGFRRAHRIPIPHLPLYSSLSS